jgi:hypothetical protein
MIKLLLVLFLFTGAGCARYTCPSINGGKEPRDKTKKMRVSMNYKPLKNGTYLVTTRNGFNVSTYITDCKPCK